MNKRPEIGQIISASAIAAICGGAATAMSVVAALALSGEIGELIIPMLLAAIGGVILSLFTALPLGALVGWITGRVMGVRPSSAALAGLATALIMFAAAMGSDLVRSGLGLTEAYWLGGFCIVGALSGLLGFRIAIGPFSNIGPPAD